VTQPTLFDFKPSNPSKIKISEPPRNVKRSPSISQSAPFEINFKSNQNKNNPEHEGKTSWGKDGEECPPGLVSYPTSPSPLPSRTRWSMDRWEKEYWKLTNKPPQEILKEAYELGDPSVLVLVDEIERGVKNDRRNPKFRCMEEYALPPGSWPLMVNLLRILKAKKEIKNEM